MPTTRVETEGKYTRELYKSSNFTDLVLKLKDNKELKVHKAIICRCPFFKAACTSGFRETHENSIKFPEADPIALELLVMSLYGFTIEESCDEMNENMSIALLVEAFDLAVMYNLSSFADSCFEGLRILLITDAALIWDFADALWHEPATNPPLRLRGLLVRMLQRNAGELAHLDERKLRRLQLYAALMYELLCRGGFDRRGLRHVSYI